MWCYRGMQKIKWPKKVANKEFHENVGEKRTLRNSILRRKINFIGTLLRINCLLIIRVRTEEVSEKSRKKKKKAP